MLTLQISVGRARVGRGKAWIQKSGIVERGEEAWGWLRHDERGRVVGLVIASVAVSVALSVLATMLVRLVEGRRSACAEADTEAPVEADETPGAAPAPESPTAPTEA
jgi:hypothetical protein